MKKDEKKIFKYFNKSKHVITIDPQLIAHAEQEGGVIIMTDNAFYKLEKIKSLP